MSDETTISTEQGNTISETPKPLAIPPIDPQPAPEQGLEARITTLETTVSKLIPVLESLVVSVTNTISDVEHINVIAVLHDVPSVLSELSELRSIVKGR